MCVQLWCVCVCTCVCVYMCMCVCDVCTCVCDMCVRVCVGYIAYQLVSYLNHTALPLVGV